jgi:hypothetical protein
MDFSKILEDILKSYISEELNTEPVNIYVVQYQENALK